jgi:hypothetical protein
MRRRQFGLQHVVPVEADVPATARLDGRGVHGVIPQPACKVGVRIGMLPIRRPQPHVDHPFDQLRVLEVQHRVVPPLKLGAGQTIAVL